MFFRKKKDNESVLGIDINSDQLKIVELKLTKNSNYRYEVINFIVKDLPNGIFKNNDKIDSEKLGTIIKEITAERKLSGKKVVCSVPSGRTVKKPFPVPSNATETEVENLIKFSGQSLASNGIETMAFDFYERQDKKPTEETKYMMLEMCPMEAVTSREEAITIGNLNPVVIETDDKPLNRLSRYFLEQYNKEIGSVLDNDKSAYLLVDVRKTNIIVTTMFKGEVESNKEHVIKSKGEVDYDQIMGVISKDLFIAQAQSNHELVNAIYLSGTSKTVFQLRDKMDERPIFKELDVLVANPFLNIKFDENDFEEIMEAAPSLVLACGLAMREVSGYE